MYVRVRVAGASVCKASRKPLKTAHDRRKTKTNKKPKSKNEEKKK